MDWLVYRMTSIALRLSASFFDTNGVWTALMSSLESSLARGSRTLGVVSAGGPALSSSRIPWSIWVSLLSPLVVSSGTFAVAGDWCVAELASLGSPIDSAKVILRVGGGVLEPAVGEVGGVGLPALVLVSGGFPNSRI